VLSFDPHAIPNEVLGRLRTSTGYRLVVAPTGRYLLPCLVFRLSTGDAIEEIDTSGPTNAVIGSKAAVSGTYGRSSEISWASWKLARVFE